MEEQERNAWKQIRMGAILIVVAGALGYWVTPFLFAIALLGVLMIVMGWTDTRFYPGHPDYRR